VQLGELQNQIARFERRNASSPTNSLTLSMHTTATTRKPIRPRRESALKSLTRKMNSKPC